MKIYTIFHADNGRGYTIPSDKTEIFATELETELDKFPRKCGYTKEQIKPFIESLKNLSVGEKAHLGVFTIECGEMSITEYELLPEFPGW